MEDAQQLEIEGPDPFLEVSEFEVPLLGPTVLDPTGDKIQTAPKKRKEYKCDVCRRCFFLPVSLSAHMKRHLGGEGFECESCGKVFSTAQNLTEHARRHTGERRYKCDMCPKDFATSSNLSQHRVCHMQRELNPFKCETCGKLFPIEESLIEHNNTMHAYTGERRYNCPTCGKCFATASNLRQHKASHIEVKAFSCEVCGTPFSSKRSLRRHVVRHTGKTGYNCETCGKPFPSSYDLNRHQSVHTGEKPYKCEVCGTSYTTNYNLTAHMRTHTMGGLSESMDLSNSGAPLDLGIHTGDNLSKHSNLDVKNQTGEKDLDDGGWGVTKTHAGEKSETINLSIPNNMEKLTHTEENKKIKDLETRAGWGEPIDSKKTTLLDIRTWEKRNRNNSSIGRETMDLSNIGETMASTTHTEDTKKTIDFSIQTNLGKTVDLKNHFTDNRQGIHNDMGNRNHTVQKEIADLKDQTGEEEVEVLDLSVKRVK